MTHAVHEVRLRGCTPEPLLSYLKALGILRLVCEDKDHGDPEARGCWERDDFVLRSRFDRDALLAFFLEHYRPTPILAPWGARSGFYPGSSETAARAALEAIMACDAARLRPYQDGVRAVRALLLRLGLHDKPEDGRKIDLLFACRAYLPDALVPWLDATYLLTGDAERPRSYAPLLGTGGNEGSGSYVANFAARVVDAVVRRQHDSALGVALFADPVPGSWENVAVGHFSPNASGGANTGQGLEGTNRANSWDYILGVEGTLLWATRAVRKLGATSNRTLDAFPFTVRPSAVGEGNLAGCDGVKPKAAKREVAELWLPLWGRPLGVAELGHLLGEGRATLGRRAAVSGVDFARAIAELGVDRGIGEFSRHVFLMRNGQSFFATPVGRFVVQEKPAAMLFREADGWLDRFRRAAGGERVPPRFAAALRRIDAAIFAYCRYGGAARFADVLVSFGGAERELAGGEAFRTKHYLPPLGGLSPKWIKEGWDGSHEVAIALALAGLFDPAGRIGRLRSNLEPARDDARPQWSNERHAVVWTSADLTRDLVAVLARRLVDADRGEGSGRATHRPAGSGLNPLASRYSLPLGTIAAFLHGEVDDRRIVDLLWGFVLVDPAQTWPAPEAPVPTSPLALPRAFALLKLLFLAEPLAGPDGDVAVRAEPDVVSRLMAGFPDEACALAMRRLRASGLRPLPHKASSGRDRDAAWREPLPVPSERLAASLLLPVHRENLRQLLALVTRDEEPALKESDRWA